ncbi:hypothetical protein [Acinetobacter sp. ANC 3832]|uniref:hypothetical protein n=1 Tax=Acinetobacter sp. ANC 3832 TaxID=1977874 RepID=UPI000A34FC80|nr:hypothetical protein [Acinetobacter sp. ANC 3832]OTG89868.1 hypothetical protein B9T35_15815 [Acinetobacter sp. ANC 3832]
MNDMSSPEKSPWGWKALIIAVILSCFFLGFFYLAVSNEPDYMPSQKRQAGAMQHDMKSDATTAPMPADEHMQMSDEEMKHMQNHASNTEHSH